jgi:hypothetical protein
MQDTLQYKSDMLYMMSAAGIWVPADANLYPLLLFGTKTLGGDERSETLRRRISAKNARPVAGLGVADSPPAAAKAARGPRQYPVISR